MTNIEITSEDLFVSEDDLDNHVVTASEDDLQVVESVVVDESEIEPVEYTEWQNAQEFTDYIVTASRNLPPSHEGSANSLRRAAQYLKNIQAELISGVEQDAAYADLNEDQLRTLDLIEEGIEFGLEQIAHTISTGLTKTATKSSKFVYYVNPFIFGLARILVNGKVSQGKNMEDLFEKLNDRYKLNDREKLELHFILNDMGHPIRSSAVDHEDMAETYFA